MLLVTGASGLLGASVLSAAVDRAWETAGICHRNVIRGSSARIVKADLTDIESTRKLLFELRPDAIVHCAAATNVDWCEDHPRQTNALNVQTTALLAEMASCLNSRFIYVSTDSVFDGQKGNYSETDEPAPLNVYAHSKLDGERQTLLHHPGGIVVRVNLYGWNAQQKESLAEWILGRLEQGEDVPGFSDVFFTPMLVNDLVPVLFAMLQEDLTGLYHVTGSEKISKFEFALRVAAAFGFDPARVKPCRVKDMNLRAVRPLDISLNTEKIRTALGLAMPDVDSGLSAFRELRNRNYPQRLKRYFAQ
jgi:dTDP-4-dehydrorhamnose reductase